MTDPDADRAVATILARDGVHLSPDEYERLVGIYAELLPQLAALRLEEVRYAEPAIIYPAAST